MNAPRHPVLLVLLAATGLGGCLTDGGGGGEDTLAADTALVSDTVAPDDTLAGDTSAPGDTTTPLDTAAGDASDVVADTATPHGTCAARCGEYVGSESCQCDPACVQYGNCCADYETLCSTGPAATDFVVAKDSECADPADWFEVTHVRDGDTIDLATGDAVRFLVMDTPEISSDDCEAWAAKAFTAAEIAASGTVCLVKDPTSDDRDLYDRLLRYVYVRDPGAGGQPINLNIRLVRLGHARLFYPYAYGRLYEPEGKTAQAAAKAEQLGGWGACGW